MAQITVNGFGQGVTFYEGPTAQGSHGDWGACGPFALSACMTAAVGAQFTGQYLDLVISRMISGGMFSPSGGTSPAGLIWYLQHYAQTLHYSVVSGVDFSGSRASATNALAGIIAACQQGKTCVMMTLQAHNLDGNEQGVYRHFVAFGGFDSGTGKLFCCNGDKVPDNIPNSPYWVSQSSILASQPCSVIVIDTNPGVGVGSGGNPGGTPGNPGGGGTTPSSGGPTDAAGQLAQSQNAILGGAGFALNAATEPFLAVTQASKVLLNQLPGIEGVVYAIDEAEQFPGIDNGFQAWNPIGSGVRVVLATIMGNTEAFAIRAGLVLVGVALMVCLGLAFAAANAAQEVETILPLAGAALEAGA